MAARATAGQLLGLIDGNAKGDAPKGQLQNVAFAYAVAGDKAKAIAAAESLRTSSGALFATLYPYTMAMIGALTLDKELALSQLAIAVREPCNLTYGDLQFRPLWDPLRSDPRFQKIVSSLAPKDTP